MSTITTGITLATCPFWKVIKIPSPLSTYRLADIQDHMAKCSIIEYFGETMVTKNNSIYNCPSICLNFQERFQFLLLLTYDLIRFECYYDGKKISFYRLYDDGKKNRINQQSNITTTKKLSKRKHGRHISVDFTIDN
ncbi:hypothetical protein DERP_000254 [Dermatophagoides pteronyssinus]|uniref:Uncharacterized protein n=1 Tax=Dermatophagoides pteronyssinus TaxID=6956 RepID=A0ABQ8IZL6_DERPT|nr:hypothetical protein DERP_000254 [Dermatophagoides pteronyssinus]